MNNMTKALSFALLSSSVLGGCSVYNTVQDVSMLMDYKVGNESIFNSEDGSQYIVSPHRDEAQQKVLACYQNSGVFSSTEEQPLRDVANEWLRINQPNMQATSSKNRSGVWEARTCYEFEYEAMPQPIGAYLDEETGNVVIVGEAAEK
ncbi:hypothetical protein [Vibrio panuliri]|nr:hypothetical protein [Vibrio panuliri]